MSARAPRQIIGDDAYVQLVFEGYEVIAADTLASKDAALAEMRVELERWQANWDANVQEMSEKFRAVNLAQVMAGTNMDLLERATAAESELALVKKALEPFAAAQGHFDGHVRDDDIVDVALRNIRAHHIRAASRALSQDGEERT